MTHLKRTTRTLCASALIALIAGCSDHSSNPATSGDSAIRAKSAPAGDGLPQNIIDAVNAAKPGGTIVAVAAEKEDGKPIYEIAVEADGQLWEVEVSLAGEVLEVERDDDADHDDADDAQYDADGDSDPDPDNDATADGTIDNDGARASDAG